MSYEMKVKLNPDDYLDFVDTCISHSISDIEAKSLNLTFSTIEFNLNILQGAGKIDDPETFRPLIEAVMNVHKEVCKLAGKTTIQDLSGLVNYINDPEFTNLASAAVDAIYEKENSKGNDKKIIDELVSAITIEHSINNFSERIANYYETKRDTSGDELTNVLRKYSSLVIGLMSHLAMYGKREENGDIRLSQQPSEFKTFMNVSDFNQIKDLFTALKRLEDLGLLYYNMDQEERTVVIRTNVDDMLKITDKLKEIANQ